MSVAPARPPARVRRVSLWRHGDFLRLWGGETVSQAGSQISVLAIPLTAIITLHASSAEVGLVTAAQFTGYLLIAPFAGNWLDRHRRRPALLGANIGRFALIAAIPLLHVAGVLDLAQLCVLVLLVGALNAVFDVGYLVYLPSLVPPEQMVDANAKLEGTYSVAQVAGPGLGGLLVQALTAPIALFANAVSYALAALSVGSIRTKEPEPARQTAPDSVWKMLTNGLLTIFRHPLLRPLIVESAWSNLFEQAALTLMYIYAVRKLHMSAGQIGLVVSASGIGGVLAVSVAERFGRWLGVGRVIGISMILGAAGMISLPVAQGSHLAVLAMLIGGFVVYGFGVSTFNVFSLSVRVATCPPALLARITATYRFVAYGTIPIGALLGGLAGGLLGLRAALVLVVSALAVGPAILIFSKVRKIRDLTSCRQES